MIILRKLPLQHSRDLQSQKSEMIKDELSTWTRYTDTYVVLEFQREFAEMRLFHLDMFFMVVSLHGK